MCCQSVFDNISSQWSVGVESVSLNEVFWLTGLLLCKLRHEVTLSVGCPLANIVYHMAVARAGHMQCRLPVLCGCMYRALVCYIIRRLSFAACLRALLCLLCCGYYDARVRAVV